MIKDKKSKEAFGHKNDNFIPILNYTTLKLPISKPKNVSCLPSEFPSKNNIVSIHH